VQVLPHGVYVAMNGRWFPWNNVRKNRETGVFEPLGEDAGATAAASPAGPGSG